MYKTYLSLVLLFLTIFRPFPVNSSCCFGFRKVCESISDVTTYGSTDWVSLVVKSGQCENVSVNTETDILSKKAFENVPGITNLYIVDRNIKYEERCFEPLKNLVYLSLIQVNNSVIPENVFHDMSKLKKLVLRDSGIEEIPGEAFKNLPKLDVLLISGNKLQKIKSGTLTSLTAKTIDLSFNIISKIQQNSFPDNLIILNLKRNNLEEIDDSTFLNLQSLEMLILSKNKLKSIRKGTFAGLNNLSKLDLSRNEIATIEKDTFSDLQELMFLYIKHNKLSVLNADIFLKDMINLTDLELDQNQLTYLSKDIFKRMPHLEEISLNGNPWQCKCLEEMFHILNNNSISVIDAEESRPKCTIKNSICEPV